MEVTERYGKVEVQATATRTVMDVLAAEVLIAKLRQVVDNIKESNS